MKHACSSGAQAVTAAIFLLILLLSVTAVAGTPATITGTVTESGTDDPLEDVTVVISDTGQHWLQSFVGEGATNSSGQFSIEIPMDPGQKREVIVEAAGPEHAPGRFNGVSDSGCYFNCGGTEGVFTISEGDSPVADLVLEPGGAIAGTITDATTGDVLEDAYVEPLRDTDGFGFSTHFRATSDGDGDYQLPLAVPASDYFLLAGPGLGQNYVIQAWEGYPCQRESCPIFNTDSVTVTAGGVETDIDFALQPAATLSGTLEPSDTVRLLRLYAADGVRDLESVFLFPGIPAWEFQGLAGGSYYLEIGPAQDQGPFVRTLHNGLLCPFGGCDRGQGAPLTVSPGATSSGHDYELEVGGKIAGTIIDADTQESPTVDGSGDLVGFYDVLDADGSVVEGAAIMHDSDKGKVIMQETRGIPPGEYFVRTYQNWQGMGIGSKLPGFQTSHASIAGYSDAAFPDVDCAGLDCDLSAATPITVSIDELTEITIEVSPGSSITGSVVDETNDEPLASAVVKLVDADNNMLAATHTDENGEFAFGGFPAGSYYLRTAMSSEPGTGWNAAFQNPYFDIVHGAASRCSEQLCSPGDGSAINLDGSSDFGPVELRVESGPVIRGQIIDVATGFSINGGYVEVFNAQGQLVGEYKVNTQTSLFQTTALEPGIYTVNPVVSTAYTSVADAAPQPTSRTPMVGIETDSEPRSGAGSTVTVGEEDVDFNAGVVDSFVDSIFTSRFEH